MREPTYVSFASKPPVLFEGHLTSLKGYLLNRAIFLLVAILGCTCFAKTQVAVLQFSGNTSLDSSQLGLLTERFQAELLKQSVFTVLERNQMQEILDEQGLQASGACDTKGCEVEIGRLLAVEKLITASVVEFDGIYALQTKLLDVQTGQVEQSWFTKVDGTLTDVLEEGCPLAAKQVLAHQMRIPFATDTTIVGKVRQQQKESAQLAASDAARKAKAQQVQQITRNSLLGVAAILGVAGTTLGISHETRARRSYKDYTAIQGVDASAQSEMDAAWTKVDDNESKRNNYYTLAGAGLALALGAHIAF